MFAQREHLRPRGFEFILARRLNNRICVHSVGPGPECSVYRLTQERRLLYYYIWFIDISLQTLMHTWHRSVRDSSYWVVCWRLPFKTTHTLQPYRWALLQAEPEYKSIILSIKHTHTHLSCSYTVHVPWKEMT